MGREEWLVKPGDTDALRETLLALLALDTQQRKALIESNTLHVQAHYSLDACHERYFALYQELHEQFPARAGSGAAR